MSKVPPNRRLYIDDEEEKYYREKGITIYEGSRGGKYVDIYEVHEKMNEERGSVGSLRELGDLREKADDILSTLLLERLREVSKEEVRMLSEIYYELNEKRSYLMASRVSGDIDDLVLKIEEFESESLNGEHMKKIILKDGSVLYAKPVVNEEIEPSWTPFNNVIASRLLKLFSLGSDFSKFIPNISIVKVGNEIFVASEEVFGILGGDAFDKKMVFSVTDNTVQFIVSGILLGLWDMNGGNFMVIPDRGIIIPFDLDFAGDLGGKVFFGPLDAVLFLKLDRAIDSEEIMKRLVDVYERYSEDDIVRFVDSIIDEYLDYLLDVGLDDYDFDDIVAGFRRRWQYVGSVINDYKNGVITARDAVIRLGSDGLKNIVNFEFLKGAKVPVEYRVYVSSWQAQRLRRNGITVYRGPRGGLYVDSRELRRKKIDTGISDISVDNILRDEVDVSSLKNSEVFRGVRNVFSKGVDFIAENLIEYKLGQNKEEYERHALAALKSAFLMNGGNVYRDSNNLMSQPKGVINFSSAGARPGILNVSNMVIYEMNDGSKVFAKSIEGNAEYTGNSFMAAGLLKVLVGEEYSSFIPTPRIIKDKKRGVFVGLSEVFGLYFDEVSMLKFDDDKINKDRFALFLAAHYALGLDDGLHNSFIDPVNGSFVQFDLDMAFLQGGKDLNVHISKVVDILCEKYGLDSYEVKKLGVRLVVEHYDELVKQINIMKGYLIYELGDDNPLLPYVDKARSWIDNIYELGRRDVDKAIRYIDGNL